MPIIQAARALSKQVASQHAGSESFMSRRAELDALRGLMLVTMVLTHLPTRLRSYSDQPLGFVSAAEGFVFLSAFVAGSDCSGAMRVGGPGLLLGSEPVSARGR